MKLLVVAATSFEIQPLLTCLNTSGKLKGIQHQVKVLETGVGMVATAFALGRILATESFDLVINAGIAGAFNPDIKIGQVVSVVNDQFSELGSEDNADFISIDELGFGESIYQPSFNHQVLNHLTPVNAITVNKVHGSQASIDLIVKRLNPQIESMEGAAVFYACKMSGLPCIQLRSISNYVEPRNKENWNIPLAIKNLNNVIINVIKSL